VTVLSAGRPNRRASGPTYGTIRRHGVGPQTCARDRLRHKCLDVCRPLGDRGRTNDYWWDTRPYQQSKQDLTAQRISLNPLGVGDDHIYVDHGLTGANRNRPGLRWRWPPAELVTRWWLPSWTAGRVATERL